MSSTSPEKTGQRGSEPASGSDSMSYAAVLLLWMGLMAALNGIRWIGGFPIGGVVEGIEQGVARTELRARGESTEEQIRKAIRSQRDTRSFWIALAAIDDFLIEPVVLAARAVIVATLFTGVAALAGRPLRYEQGLAESARIQGLWVLGLALRTGMMVSLRRPENQVETSLALLLPPGSHPAWLWMALRQLDMFALLGWGTLAAAGWRRGEASLAAALGLCGGLGLAEVTARTGCGLLVGGATRLSLMVR